jgi:hypothetical protein
MICNLIRFVVSVQLLVLQVARCDAAVIWTYNLADLGASGSLGNPYALAKTGLTDGGVTFNASLVVTGSGNIGYQQFDGTNGGIGVNGNTLDGGSGTESLRFTMQLSNVIGGSVAFNGFSIVGFNGFGSTDLGMLSLDNDFLTAGDNSPLDDFGGTLPSISVPGTSTAFSIFSNSSNHFQVSFVTGSFTGTAAAVPEPSATVAFVLVVASTPLLRRFRRRANSVDSESLVA